MLKKLLFLVLFFCLCIFSPAKTEAVENSFITIVNPVRISTYVDNPTESLSAEYGEVAKKSLPATWLLTFDVINDPKMVDVVKGFNKNQEIGIFLEVTPDFSEQAGVVFNKRDSWHRATSLFLSGYQQEDRKKLIDEVFSKFKKAFGYYPKSVGSWWTDAYSLEYMSGKYGISANLSVSDQFALDGYQIWGTYWSTPYYPSKNNAAIPAPEVSNKTDVVMLRWAPRDPVNGYKSPTSVSSGMYSPQDYETINLPDSYFEELTSFFTLTQPYNKFAHLTVGLESDFPPDAFRQDYAKKLNLITNLSIRQGSTFLTMEDFAEWYRGEFKGVSPSQLIISDDFLGSTKKGIWYQNRNYRMGFLYNMENSQLTLRDFRIYHSNTPEPFYKSPNGQDGLYVSLPYIIDSVIEPKTSWRLSCGSYISAAYEGGADTLRFENCSIRFNEDSIEISGENTVPKSFLRNENIKVEETKDRTTIYPVKNYFVPQDGLVIENIGFRVPFALSRRIPIQIIDFIPFIMPILVAIFIFAIYESSKRFGKRMLPVLGFVSLAIFALFLTSYQKLYISQDEVGALGFLSRLPAGNVIVYDKDCLRCRWETRYEPAAMAGSKGYIEKLSGKKVFQSLGLPLAKSEEDIKREIRKVNAKYLYLTKYETNVELLPFSPESLGLNKLFENANVQIWEVVK